MATYDDADHVVLSTEEARAGVTGHNVRYVLAFGMAGVVAAFAAIAIYFGFDHLHETLSSALSHSPSEIVRMFAPYAAIVLLGAIIGALLLGLWNTVSGPSDDESQMFMRLRVVTQFALILVIMAMLWIAVG